MAQLISRKRALCLAVAAAGMLGACGESSRSVDGRPAGAGGGGDASGATAASGSGGSAGKGGTAAGARGGGAGRSGSGGTGGTGGSAGAQGSGGATAAGRAGAAATGGSSGTAGRSSGAGGTSSGAQGGTGGSGGEGAQPPDCLVDCPAGEGCLSIVDPNGCIKLCPHDGPVVLKTQKDVADLAAQGCEYLEADLVVSGPDVTSLAGLEGIRLIDNLTVDGATALPSLSGLDGLVGLSSLMLKGPLALESLAGLEGLTSVGGDIDIAGCDSLADLSALGNATFGSGALAITSTPKLKTLDGLNRMRGSGSILLASDPALENVDALANLEQVGAGNILCSGNDGLKSFVLPKLRRIKGQTGIYGNSSLQTLSLPALTQSDLDLSISGNAALETIDLDALVFITDLSITTNTALTSIGTLPELAHIEQLTVAGNSMLPQCQVDAIDARFGVCDYCTDNDDLGMCP